MQVKRILVQVGLDGEGSPAIEQAAALAAKHQASITLATVVEELPRLSRIFMPESSKQWGEVVRRKADERLDRYASDLKGQGLDVHTSVIEGKPPVEIVREAQRGQFDIVLKDVDPDSDDPTSPIGSADMRLLRKCPVPVWLVRADAKPGIQRVLAAIDPEPDDPAGDALNRKIFAVASALAENEGSQLHVVRAWEAPGETLMLEHESIEGANSYAEAVERGIQAALNDFLAQFPDAAIRTNVHLIHGDAEHAISHCVAKEKIDLLVIGTVARSGIPGYLMGNTAEQVLDQISCSVLTVKPDSFKTPIAAE